MKGPDSAGIPGPAFHVEHGDAEASVRGFVTGLFCRGALREILGDALRFRRRGAPILGRKEGRDEV